MHRTVLEKGGVGKPYDVYADRNLSRKVRRFRDGDVGFAVIGERITALVYSGSLQMWMPPGIAIEAAGRSASQLAATAA